MSGPYKALRTDIDDAGVAYCRRASASFDGLHLNIFVKGYLHYLRGAAALYEVQFNSGDIQATADVGGHPSVYQLQLNTASGTYSETLLSTDIPDALGRPTVGPDPIAGLYILPHGIVASLGDPWASPENY